MKIPLEQVTLIPPNEITKFGIPYCRGNIEVNLEKEDMEKWKLFGIIFTKLG